MSSFCVVPFYSQENRRFDITPCCLLPQGADVDKIKQEFLQGKRPQECSKCWKSEELGLVSRRIHNNYSMENKYDLTLDEIFKICLRGENKIVLYQITTSNLCDQACVTCGSACSTKWAELERRANIPTMPLYQLDLRQANIDYVNLDKIAFVGGEPLIDPKTFEILEKLADHDNFDISVSFVTNGSSMLNQQQLDLIKKFKTVGFTVSIDGVDAEFEYMRWPGRWNRLLDNIKQYQQIGKVNVSYTVSSINAYYYNKTMSWFEQQNLEVTNVIFVTWPEWCSLARMPVALKKTLADYNNTISPMFSETGSELSVGELIEKITQQDLVRGTDIRTAMPEFWKVLQFLN
jgi:sulfatase maturation enzyme AslB (radical SAM superfamily)